MPLPIIGGGTQLSAAFAEMLSLALILVFVSPRTVWRVFGHGLQGQVLGPGSSVLGRGLFLKALSLLQASKLGRAEQRGLDY